MKNWLTKNNILLLAIVSFLLTQLWPYLIQGSTCGKYLNWWWQLCKTIEDALFPLYILAVPLTVLYFLRDEVFQSWVRFVLVWAPLSFIFTVLNGPYSSVVGPGSEGISRILGWITIMMSLFLLILRSWDLRRNDQGNPPARWVMWSSFVLAFVLSVILSVYLYRIF